MFLWDVQAGVCGVKVGRIASHEGMGLLGILLATSPQSICSQDISITPFCMEINPVVRGSDFRPEGSSRRFVGGLLL